MDLALSKAPDLLFDQQIWAAFTTYFDTADIALERISCPPQIPGGYYHRHGDKLLPATIREKDQIIAEARDLGVALLRGFQDLLLHGHIVASGIPIRNGGETEHEVIPAESWLRLWPNLAHNYAMAFARPGDQSCGRYDDIRLSIKEPQLLHAELVANCSRFLRSRQAEGESRRKVLISETSLNLGLPIPFRIFNAAYKEVFKQPRGRPRKNN
jgi:hypothetical protein